MVIRLFLQRAEVISVGDEREPGLLCIRRSGSLFLSPECRSLPFLQTSLSWVRTPGLWGVSGGSPLRECYLENLIIIGEKNLTLQLLVFAVVLFLAFGIDDLEIFLHQLFSFLH